MAGMFPNGHGGLSGYALPGHRWALLCIEGDPAVPRGLTQYQLAGAPPQARPNPARDRSRPGHSAPRLADDVTSYTYLPTVGWHQARDETEEFHHRSGF